MPHKDPARRAEYQLEYQRSWARRRYEALARLKVRLGCSDCGFNSHPAALEFDHLPGTEKKFGIGYGYRRKLTELLEELAKCEVVCANCHAIRTAERRK